MLNALSLLQVWTSRISGAFGEIYIKHALESL